MSICLIFDSQIVSRIYRMHNSNVNGGTAYLVLVLINLEFHEFIIPIPPPLLEQKRIVSKIESIFAKIDAKRNFIICTIILSYDTRDRYLDFILISDLQLIYLQNQERISNYLKFHLQGFLVLVNFLGRRMFYLLTRICLVSICLLPLFHHKKTV